MFRLKQRTLPWAFDIIYRPGSTNNFADATSRHPSSLDEQNYDGMPSLMSSADLLEVKVVSSVKNNIKNFTIDWDEIVRATNSDNTLCQIRQAIEDGFSIELKTSDCELNKFHPYVASIYVLEGVLLYNDRVIIPLSLRSSVLSILHSAHQGVSSMIARAKSLIFWPGLSKDIHLMRANCLQCNRNAPSQCKPPHISPIIPTTPFECIFADYFDINGKHYLVAGDRLSGWVEIFSAPHHTQLAGSQGLQSALRTLFATFGVPKQLSSDGGPEFSSTSTITFLNVWGVEHRMSSSYFPQSNGRAEVAVKKAKRLLTDNISPNGSLNTDNLLRALLQVRNTPDKDSKLSLAQVIFGRPLRDAFSFINRQPFFNSCAVQSKWHEIWKAKEQGVVQNEDRASIRLNEHNRLLKPLDLGDCVFIQNQHGPAPTKWDKTGTIVEHRPHDQYIVKVSGSGRLTLRNRRFLRKRHGTDTFLQSQPNIIVPHTHTSPEAQSCSGSDNAEEVKNRIQNVAEQDPDSPEHKKCIPSDTDVSSTVDSTSDPERLSSDHSSQAPIPTEVQRPQRNRQPRRIYEPESGHWVEV